MPRQENIFPYIIWKKFAKIYKILEKTLKKVIFFLILWIVTMLSQYDVWLDGGVALRQAQGPHILAQGPHAFPI